VEVKTAGKKERELDDLRRVLLEAKDRFGIRGVVTGTSPLSLPGDADPADLP